MYRFVTGGYHDNSLRTLLIVSRLRYIVMLKHGLLHAYYDNAIMNMYIHKKDVWILKLVPFNARVANLFQLNLVLHLHDLHT